MKKITNPSLLAHIDDWFKSIYSFPSRYKYLTRGCTSFLLLLFLAALIFYISGANKGKNAPKPEVSTKKFNPIHLLGDSIIMIKINMVAENHNAHLSKDNTFLFELYKYVLNKTNITAYKESIKTNIEELNAELSNTYKIVGISINGGADDTYKNWYKPIESEPYAYNTIEYTHSELDAILMDTRKTRYIHRVDSLYTNNDLPFLRAKFVKEAIVSPVLQENNLIDSISIIILNSPVISHAFSRPIYRGVDIGFVLSKK